jgi:hypothetical protein
MTLALWITRKEAVVAYSMHYCLPEGAEKNYEHIAGKLVSLSVFELGTSRIQA